MSALLETQVDPGWVDYNGHMNDAAYALVFSRGTDALMDRVGLDAAGRARHNQTIYTLSMLIHYLHEVHPGARLRVEARVLEHDAKRMRVWLELFAGDVLAATSEQLILCVRKSPDGAKAARFAPEVAGRVAALAAASAALPLPEKAGGGIALRRK